MSNIATAKQPGRKVQRGPNRYKRWVVVVFTEAKDYSVVPVNWLINDEKVQFTISNIMSINYCQWPPFKVTSNELIRADDPDASWKCYKIRILDYKIYADFKKAWHKQVEIETSATEDDFDIQTRKRPRSSSEDSEELEDNNLSILPINNNFEKLTSEEETTKSFTELLVSSGTEQLSTTVQSYQEPSTSFDENTNKATTLHNPNINESLYNEPYIPAYTSSYLNLIDSGSINPLLSEVLTNMQKELVANNLILKRILAKVEVLETIVKHNNLHPAMGNSIAKHIDSDFLALFPINTKEQFLIVEDNILNQSDFIPKLEWFITSIGGVDTKYKIIRVLQKIFSNQFAVISTWTGRGKNITITLGTSEVLKQIQRIIKHNSPNIVTDSEFESVVANWLRHANTRLSRSKQL